MNILLTVIITILIIQAVFTLLLAIDEEKALPIVCGIWFLFVYLGMMIFSKIHLIYCKKKYDIYMFYFNGQPTQGYYMTKKMAQLFKTDPEEEYSIELWKKGEDMRSTPYKTQIINKKKLDKDSIKPYLKTRKS